MVSIKNISNSAMSNPLIHVIITLIIILIILFIVRLYIPNFILNANVGAQFGTIKANAILEGYIPTIHNKECEKDSDCGSDLLKCEYNQCFKRKY